MKKFVQYINFTKNETRVIIFLIAVLTAGFAIKYYKEVLTVSKNTPYDFSKSDSVFNVKSKNAFKNKRWLNNIDTLNIGEDSLVKLLEASDDSLSLKENFTERNSSNDIPDKSININTASKEELIDLPGIGEAIAERIIIYRDEKKGFRRIDELMKVKGIGKKKFEKIKNYIKSE